MKEHTYRDGEVIGVDTDKCLIVWNSKTQQGENCGETLEQFGGKDNLFPKELKRIEENQS